MESQAFIAKKLQKTVNDGRYTIAQEYTGKSEPSYVLRFCGEFISASETLNDAIFSAIFHQDERLFKML